VAKRTTKLLDPESLLNYALRLLGGRAYSMGELREKMRPRAEQAESIDTVIAKLKESGYVDDKKFAENYAAARLENEGFGKMRVLRDLRQRRVAPKLAEQVTERAFQSTDETELVEAFLKRKFRGKDLGPFLKEPKNLAAAYRRLRYAGFSSGGSIRVLKRYANRAEELEGMEE
jgi:regulatory protein